jgi:hypothetical protein
MGIYTAPAETYSIISILRISIVKKQNTLLPPITSTEDSLSSAKRSSLSSRRY